MGTWTSSSSTLRDVLTMPLPHVPRAGGRLTALLVASHAVCTVQMCTTSRFGAHQGGRSIGAKKKIRHHVNPLKSTHQTLLELPEQWPTEFFAEPSKPLHIDIGCARGLFCLEAAEMNTDTNYLGLEIRSQLVDAAREDVEEYGMKNVNFFACNANVNFEHLLQYAAPHRPLSSVSIQFPGE